jgi:SAM-dependent methyltransferase
MNLLDRIHEGYVHDRRTRVLSALIARTLPRDARVLDIGCGDGLISSRIRDERPDVAIEGVDILVRPNAHIAVRQFDGTHLPYGDRSFDAVLFVDVLHHASDPVTLIGEAMRVSRGVIVVKDHTRTGFLAGPTLHFMDRVGNVRHGVSIPADYWPEARWREVFMQLGLTIERWSNDVPLYPPWAAWIFGRSLHFVATLNAAANAAAPSRVV